MDDIMLDAVRWHNCTFIRTNRGEYWRIFFAPGEVFPSVEEIDRNAPEWIEPLTELKRRLYHYGEE